MRRCQLCACQQSTKHGTVALANSMQWTCSNLLEGERVPAWIVQVMVAAPIVVLPFLLLQVTVAAVGIVICYADRSNMSTAILPMAEAYHWDKVCT